MMGWWAQWASQATKAAKATKESGSAVSNERVRPGHHVAAGVEAQQQQNQKGHEQAGAGKVDAPQGRRRRRRWVCSHMLLLVRRHAHEPGDEDGRDERDGDLDEKGEAPAAVGPAGPDVLGEAAEDAAQHGAGRVGEVADALDDAAAAQRHEVRGQERGNGHEAAAANAGNGPAGQHGAGIAGEAADEVAGGKEQVAEDEAGAAADDVGDAARDGLAGGIGHEIGRGDHDSRLSDWNSLAMGADSVAMTLASAAPTKTPT